MRRAVRALCVVAGMQLAAASCPNHCNGHGRCDNPSTVCNCDQGYIGGDCSEQLCPTGPAWADRAVATDTAHQEAECSNRGICDRTTGRCACQLNFVGAACERMECSSDCNGHGECRSIGYHLERLGYVYNRWDRDQLYGCHCDDGYEGFDCSLRECPVGDDPMTTGQANEVQVFQCNADTGTFTLSFEEHTTAQIDATAGTADVKSALEALPNIRADSIAVAFSSGTEVCDSTNQPVTSVTFTQNFQPQRRLVFNAGTVGSGNVEGPNRVDSIAGVQPVVGTKESEQCSDRGFCDETTGYCSCYRSFATSNGLNDPGDRGDCGYATGVITFCPGETSCSGHGLCSGAPSYTCTCEDGWTGGDCAERTCPSGVAWFWTPPVNEDDEDIGNRPLAECSNMGLCDRATGVCGCRTGFEGAACERLSCPFNEDGICSGHGQCLNMASLAKVSAVDAQATDFTYGATPNDEATWDYDKVHGCFCDAGYEGYDCSLRSCASGDDARTPGVNEVQALRCIGDGGTLQLEFGHVFGVGVVSSDISATATASELKAALQSMQGVGTVSVSLVNGTDGSAADAFCSADADVAAQVTFETRTGHLPLFRNLSSHLSALTCSTGCSPVVEVYGRGDVLSMSGVDVETTKSTREDKECAGRGLCSNKNGVCTCFLGYSSSDGQGNPGTRGDCGYLMPVAASNAAEAAATSSTA